MDLLDYLKRCEVSFIFGTTGDFSAWINSSKPEVTVIMENRNGKNHVISCHPDELFDNWLCDYETGVFSYQSRCQLPVVAIVSLVHKRSGDNQ